MPGVRYDPKIGIFGFDVIVSLERPGYRVMRKKRKRSKVPKKHRVSRDEAVEFIEKILGAKVV